jgi:hypothetical protein
VVSPIVDLYIIRYGEPASVTCFLTRGAIASADEDYL